MVQRLFLERRTYRLNRLQDAARLLPALGLVLIFGPIFIRDSGVESEGLSITLVYYFGVWLGLIVLTAIVSRALARLGAQAAQMEADAAPDPPPHKGG